MAGSVSEPIRCVPMRHAAHLQGRFPEMKLVDGLMAVIGEGGRPSRAIGMTR